MLTVEQNIAKALEIYTGEAFANKAKKKQAMEYVNHAYDRVRGAYFTEIKAIYDAEIARLEADYSEDELLTPADLGGVRWRTDLGMKLVTKATKSHDVPFSLVHVRDHHFTNIFNVIGSELADQMRFLVDLRAEMKDAEVAPKKERDTSVERTLKFIGIDPSRFADRPLASEAFAVLREMKPEEIEGFRSQHVITFTAWHVVNEFGTEFYRHMFYLNGKREAFAVAMSFVSADFDQWLLNGQPDMTGKSITEIKEFYNKVAA